MSEPKLKETSSEKHDNLNKAIIRLDDVNNRLESLLARITADLSDRAEDGIDYKGISLLTVLAEGPDRIHNSADRSIKFIIEIESALFS